MQLDTAVNVARQALIATQQQIAISGRNVAAASDPTRSRSVAVMATTVDGGVRVAGYKRAEDVALYMRMIQATSATASADAVLTHLKVLADTVGDPKDGVSPAALIGDLTAAIADYANAPDDAQFGRTAVERAREVTNALNNVAGELDLLRERADREMANSVATVNDLLGQFDRANAAVKTAYALGDDPTLWQDRRDAVVAQISEHMGISVMHRDGGDVALFTDSGITLFDRTARTVQFARTPVFTAATIGGTVIVDGMPVTGPGAPMPLQTGSIVGNATVRDAIAPTYRLQMDEIARALVATFADGSGSLFVTAGPPDTAGTIAVGAGVDPFQGGDVTLLRDGTGNPGALAAYPDRLLRLGEDLKAVLAFDPATELPAAATLQRFATGSVGWLEAMRKGASETVTKESAILTGASEALSRATGVNLDDEYAQQLIIERNFAASAKLIAIIDEMFAVLLEIA